MNAPDGETPVAGEVADAASAHALGADYVAAVGKLVTSHVRNELAGAAAFDEPAIALAPGPKGSGWPAGLPWRSTGTISSSSDWPRSWASKTRAAPGPFGVRLRGVPSLGRLKHRTNDQARAQWAGTCRQFVEDELGLRFPQVDLHWNG
jgi:hypothetical protein